MSSPTAARGATGLVLAVLTTLAAVVVGPSGASAADASSEVYLVQGVPGSFVDIELDGREIESAVATKTVVGPLDLPAGEHTVTFTSTEWSVTTSFDAASPSIDVVLHWPADPAQQPDTTVYTNDVSPVSAGKGRLTVAHTAVVPPADVRVDGTVIFANIANGEFVTADVPAETYPVDIVPTGGTSPLLGPVDLDVRAGALTRVFAIGQPTDGSMDAVVQVLSSSRGGSDAPSAVDAGSAGLVAPGRDGAGQATRSSGPVLGALLAALVVVAAVMALAGRGRRPARR